MGPKALPTVVGQMQIKMYQEKYNINWHTYSKHLEEMLNNLMKTSELADVTLVCDDNKKIKAHKVILSSCSSIFKNIFDDLSQRFNNSVIYLRGIQYQEMESILEFMYLGVATIYQERLNEFFNVAKNLYTWWSPLASYSWILLKKNKLKTLELGEPCYISL